MCCERASKARDIHGGVVQGALGVVESNGHSVGLDIVLAVELLTRAPYVETIEAKTV